MASVKTGAGRARARTSDAMGASRGASPEISPEDHGVVAMASVKTGAGRAGARTSDAMGASRGASPGMGVSSRRGSKTLWRRAFTLIFATTGWSQKGAMAWATDRRKGMTTAARAWRW